MPPLTRMRVPARTSMKSSDGFTLMELLVATALFGILAGILMISFLISRRSYLSADGYVRVQQEARHAFDIMLRELRNSGSVGVPSSQRLDFQIARGYDSIACGGICWGDETANGRWIHYVLDTSVAQNVRLMRCTTALQDDPMPAGFAGCRVLANDVNPNVTATSIRV